MTTYENPLEDLESVYLDSDWDRAYRRAANTGRANLDLIRVLLFLAEDIRAIRAAIEKCPERKSK